MAKKELDKYKGRLTAEEVADGMNAAERNAMRLAEDAELLLEGGRFPSAAALAILAIEEAGKVTILRQLSLNQDDDKARNDCWRDYRSHTKKNVSWPLPQLVAAGARSLDDFSPLFSKGAYHPFLLDQVKQISLYTDCLGDAHWSEPAEVINEDLAKMLVRSALAFKTSQHDGQGNRAVGQPHETLHRAGSDCQSRRRQAGASRVVRRLEGARPSHPWRR